MRSMEWSADQHGFRSFVAQMSALCVRWRLPPPVTTEQLQSSSRSRRAWRSGAKLYASLRLWRTRSTAVMWAAGTTRSRLGTATCRRHCTVTAGPHPSALLRPPPHCCGNRRGRRSVRPSPWAIIGRCVANQRCRRGRRGHCAAVQLSRATQRRAEGRRARTCGGCPPKRPRRQMHAAAARARRRGKTDSIAPPRWCVQCAASVRVLTLASMCQPTMAQLCCGRPTARGESDSCPIRSDSAPTDGSASL
jgi:hypothetical protein